MSLGTRYSATQLSGGGGFGAKGTVIWPSAMAVSELMDGRVYDSTVSSSGQLSIESIDDTTLINLYVCEYLGKIWRFKLTRSEVNGLIDLKYVYVCYVLGCVLLILLSLYI